MPLDQQARHETRSWGNVFSLLLLDRLSWWYNTYSVLSCSYQSSSSDWQSFASKALAKRIRK